MRFPRIGLAPALGLLLAAGLVPAAGPVTPERRAIDKDVERVAAKIDEVISAKWVKAGVQPSPAINDAAFLRRVSLDVVGKIPPVNDLRKFISNRAPDKRAAAVDRLLDSPGYVNHFTNIWRDLLVPEARADFQRRFLLPGIDRWLRDNFRKNAGFDKMVRDLVAMPMNARQNDGRLGFYDDGSGGQASPMPFYLAKQGKPEEIAASVGRLFLGVRLECAQCHDHPFGKWKREQFWSQAAFFAGVTGQRNGDFFFGPLSEAADRRELAIPNTDRVAQARFLDDKLPKWRFKVGARTTLAEWMTAKDNPFFARAFANRMWAHFFGVGLVDPVDDIVDDNPASHPELLELLAREFAEHDFDIKFLIRAITSSRAYQLASTTSDPTNPPDLRLFARMPVKGLTPEQLYDSLREATGHRDNTLFVNRIYDFGSARAMFQDKFGEQEKKIDNHTSIPQALTMMNNQLIADATSPERAQVLGAIVSSNFMSEQGKLEALYLSALSRQPTSEERGRMLRYVERGGAAKDKKKAYADIFWALLNSTEFRFNH